MSKQYDTECKVQAVRVATESNKPVAQIAGELGIPSRTLPGWIKATRQDPHQAFIGSGRLRPAAREVPV